jgi:hypothetical protein
MARVHSLKLTLGLCADNQIVRELACAPPTNLQGNVRNQVQQNDADLENRHPGVVKHVKLFN